MEDRIPEKVLLSIVILTRNRKNALKRALISCVECTLPPITEFVIVDNASQDGTSEVVDLFFTDKAIKYQYYYLPENIGVAAGRNEGYKRAKGRYIYFLDDDAYIDGPKELFFIKMIDFFNNNPNTFAITTTIYDTALKGVRSLIPSKNNRHEEDQIVLMFHGGSVLVDKNRYYDQDQLFLKHQFRGMQELYPCLKSYFSDRYVVNLRDLVIIHDPDELARFSDKKVLLLHYTHATQIKQIFYPSILFPILYLFFCLRIIKHAGISELPGAVTLLSKINKGIVKETVSMPFLIKLVNEFGVVRSF